MPQIAQDALRSLDVVKQCHHHESLSLISENTMTLTSFLWNFLDVPSPTLPSRGHLKDPSTLTSHSHTFWEPPVERHAKARIMPCLFNATWLATMVYKNVPKDVGNEKIL